MSVYQWVLINYLGLSGVAIIYWFIQFLIEDIRMYRNPWMKSASKFGYNLKWKGVGWYLLATLLPIVNIFLLVFVIYARYKRFKDERKNPSRT